MSTLRKFKLSKLLPSFLKIISQCFNKSGLTNIEIHLPKPTFMQSLHSKTYGCKCTGTDIIWKNGIEVRTFEPILELLQSSYCSA